MRLGMFLPHEIMAKFYEFKNGDLFYAFMTGSPFAPWLDWARLDSTLARTYTHMVLGV